MIYSTVLDQFTARLLIVVRLAALLALVGAIAMPGAQSTAQTSPTLGVAESFSVLAKTTITNVPTSTISGDVGLSPATGANIGLTASEVGGTIYAVDAFGPMGSVMNPGLLTTAINDMMTVFNGGTGVGIDQPCTTTYAGVQDLTLVSPLGPGVYCADAFLLTGNLTLSGSGVWIFKSAATLTTSAGSSVTGGDPCNVWWRLVSDADIFPNSSIVGNILAGTSINMQNGASLNGRALAQAAVTLDANLISGPVCAPVQVPTATAQVPTATAQAPTATAQVPPATAQVPTATPPVSSPDIPSVPSDFIQYEIVDDVTPLSSPGGSPATDSSGLIVLHAGEHWFGSPTTIVGSDGRHYIEIFLGGSGHVFVPVSAVTNAPTTIQPTTTWEPTGLPLTGYPPADADRPDNRLPIVVVAGCLLLIAATTWRIAPWRNPR